MIKLSDADGGVVYLAPSAIAQIHQAGTSSQWHGIRSHIKTFDGKSLSVRESADEIAAAVAASHEERS